MTNESRTYTLPTQSIPSLSLSHHVADLVEVQAFLQSRGIETRNTRIERYIKYLEHAVRGDQIDEAQIFKNTSDPRFQSGFDWRLYLLREAHELMWILKGLKVHIPEGVDEKLQKIVSGCDFAALDTHTESRNTQFELRIASYFCQAGCEVDLSTKTDVIATTEEFAFYVECKRIAGPRGLRENLLKAKSQLIERMPVRHGGKMAYGFIAADVTKAAFSHNGLTWGLTNEHSRELIQEKLVGIADAAERTPVFVDYPELLGCWLQIHIPSLIRHPPAMVTRFSSLAIDNPNLEREAQKAAEIFDLMASVGNRPDPRELPATKMVRRTSVSLPAGTRFQLDDRLLRKFLAGDDSYGKISEDIIAGIIIDGVEHEFSFLEFEMLPKALHTQLREEFAANSESARLALILEMYIRRYPYENGPDLGPV